MRRRVGILFVSKPSGFAGLVEGRPMARGLRFEVDCGVAKRAGGPECALPDANLRVTP